MAPRDESDDEPDGGDAKARQQADSYLQLAYDELRAIARQLLRGERPSHTLQATALVHEAWMRLSASGASFRDEAVFRRLAVRTMRRALVDHARKRFLVIGNAVSPARSANVITNSVSQACNPISSRDAVGIRKCHDFSVARARACISCRCGPALRLFDECNGKRFRNSSG